ncbi:MAG: class IV adenylate cyclase [Acidobacteria bacterium]|nr:class IV adenylate cyclase [Acidobacteriota bacterium]
MPVKPGTHRDVPAKSIETEVKIELADLPKVRDRLVRLGFRIRTPRTFEDNWIFDFPDRSLARRRQLLRVRSFGDRAWITLKTPSRHSTRYKIRRELETELGDARVLRQLLKSLGFEPAFRYQKFRTVLEPGKPSGKKLTVTFDETPIGIFLEIEGSARDIPALAAKLGYKPADFIQDSYWQLYRKRRPRSSGTSMIFRKRG